MSSVNVIFVILLNILVNIYQTNTNQSGCYIFDKELIHHLGTKTPYRAIANVQDSVIQYEGCYPIRILGVIRHGTRTPGKKAVKKIKRYLEPIRDEIRNYTSHFTESLCDHNSNPIKNWQLLIEKEGEKVLTAEGEDEMFNLAKRFQKRFPDLLDKQYSNDSYQFRFTDTQRASESAKFFTKGLFGDEISQNVWYPQPVFKDPILRFYKLCDKWRKEIKKNPNALYELNEYIRSEEVEDLIERISKRIGLNYTLNYEAVHLMYITCSFETAWYKDRQSSWCSLFSEADLKIIEYADELKYYWIDGYGFSINHNQACPLINNVFSIFNSEISPSAVFYFTHSGTILKMLSHLGLYKDEYKLTHNIQNKLKESRKWRVSKVDTFSSNLVFVLFNCMGELKVLLLHQERIVKLPGCGLKNDLCSLKKLEQLLNVGTCDFTNMCSLKNEVHH